MEKKRKAFFRNKTIDKKCLTEIMSWSFRNFGITQAAFLSDSLKEIGLKYATKAGISISIEDLKMPPLKTHFIQNTEEKIKESQIRYYRGEITESERVEIFTKSWNITSELLKNEMINYLKDFDPLNPLYIMAISGARGNISQIKQILGIRGLMVGPSGEIIDIPITKNFREGLTITDYMISAYGARKGVVDTALKTADSGYLTRRLVDVAQDILIKENDCFSKKGIFLYPLKKNKGDLIKLKDRLFGRVLARSIIDPKLNFTIAIKDEQINENLINKFDEKKIKKVLVRSPLTCELIRSICKNCYGWNLSRGKLVDLGEAVGIIAAHSIGEPGTQLTMRTFHTGGIYSSESNLQIFSKVSCKIIFPKKIKIISIKTEQGAEAFFLQLETNIKLIDFENKISHLFLKKNAIIFIKNNDFVKKNEIISSFYEKIVLKKQKKNIFSNVSGEIFLKSNFAKIKNYVEKNKNKIIWVLFAKIINIPLYAKINKNKFYKLKLTTSLANAKLINSQSGILQILKEKYSQILNISNINLLVENFSIPNSPLYKTFLNKNMTFTNNNFILLKLYNDKYFYLKKILNVNKKFFVFGEQINTNYRTKVDGTLFFIRLRKNLLTVSSKKSTLQQGGAIFFLTRQKLVVLKKNLFPSLNSEFWLKKNSQISNNLFNKNSGFITLFEFGSFVLINLKSCSYIKFNEKKIKIKLKLNKQLIFPGEKIFNRIFAKKIIYTNFVKDLNIKDLDSSFILFRPIFLYEFEKTKTPKKLFYENKINKKVEKFNSLTFKRRRKVRVRNKKSVNIINTKLFVINNNKFLKEPIVKAFFLKDTNNNYSLNFDIFENIFCKNNFKNNLNSIETKISLLVENLQYVESNTLLAYIEYLPKIETKIINLKEKKYLQYKRILIVSKKDYKTFYTENKNLIFRKKGSLKIGDFISKHLIIANCGFIEKNAFNKITIRLGKISLFSNNCNIFYLNNDFIKESEILGFLFYRVSEIGDIIKGLPKIEEILEARKFNIKIKSIKNPGLLLDIKMDFLNAKKYFDQPILKKNLLNLFLFINKFGLRIYRYKQVKLKKLFISREDFIKVGKPINRNISNPHNTIKYLNRYYKEFLDPYNAAYRTLKKIQSYLLFNIQIIYSSQNVKISDKHIEIIIKKMTAKVIIDSKGDSGISNGEYLDLAEVNHINKILSKTNSKKILYRPILFGITKASLITESFISAASFQNTIKILTNAAIEGKVDWLKGLKENVIIGRLIPVGTGFNFYDDISYLNLRFPKESVIKDK